MIVPGTYTVSHVSLHASNIILYYEHGSAVTVPGQRDTFFKCSKLLIYHRAEAFDIRLSTSKHMHLDRTRFLEIELSSGWNNVTNGELQIRAATAGLRIQTSEAKIVDGNIELSKKLEAGMVRFGALAADTTAKLSVPYSIEHESPQISLRLELSYTTEHGTFFFAAMPTVSISLPLGVNVQDVFKHTTLFSRFSISSSIPSPLRLLSTQLDGSDIFEAQCGPSFLEPLVVFPRQPASMLYKITRSEPTAQTVEAGKKIKKALSLKLHYICLEEEIDDAIALSLQQALQATSMHTYSRLVIRTVTNELRTRSSPHDLERIALLSEISTSVLTNVKWRDYFSGLGQTPENHQDVAALLAEGIKAWRERTPSIPLKPISAAAEAMSAVRSIIIPVEVPSVTVVHTADLKLLKSSLLPASTAIAASNHPIPTSLNIKWTRMWDASLQNVNDQASRSDDLEFVYEVSGASDTWLIGGRRKGHFKVPNHPKAEDSKQRLSFPIVLIPLREGFLPFPNVDIRPAPPVKVLKPNGEESSPRMKSSVTCETDFKNVGETIRVISGARKTTVSLDASGPQGGAMLLDSEWRADSEKVVSG